VGIPQPRQKDHSSSVAGEKSRLKVYNPEDPVFQSVDFNAISDSSTGGAGLARPYGIFPACRNGDGTAVWERAPLEQKDRVVQTRIEPQSSAMDFEVRHGVGGGKKCAGHYLKT
jgi:hypothetical protein